MMKITAVAVLGFAPTAFGIGIGMDHGPIMDVLGPDHMDLVRPTSGSSPACSS